MLVRHARRAAACGGRGGEAGARGWVAGGVVMGARCPPAVMMAAEVSVVFWVWWLIIVYELFAGRKEKRKA